MAQTFIQVDQGTGQQVDFFALNGGANVRQVVAIGDPAIDANYVNVSGGAMFVNATITNSPAVTITSGSVALTAGSADIGSITVAHPLPAGTNTIGNVILAAGSADVATVTIGHPLPTGTNTIGNVGLVAGSALVGTMVADSVADTATMFAGPGVALTPLFSVISASTNGNNVLIGTVSSKRIRVVAMNLVTSASTGIYLLDSAGTVIWAGSANSAAFAANGGIVLPFNPVGWFQTGSGNALVMNLAATSSTGGSITYLTV